MTEQKQNEKIDLIVSILKEAGEALTLAQVNERAGEVEIKAGTMTGAVRRNLVAVAGKTEVLRPSKSKVTVYALITKEAQKGADGKEFNYSDSEKAILNALEQVENATLAEISEIAEKKLSSGSINALVKKGNVEKVGQRDKVGYSKSQVNTYIAL